MAFHFSRPKTNDYRYIVHRNPSTEKPLYDTFVANNTVVFNPAQRKNIKSDSVKIRGEVWKNEFHSAIPDGYVYLNKIQRAFYGLAYGDTVEVTPFIALSNPFDEQLQSLNVDLFSVGRKMEIAQLMNNESRLKAGISNTLVGNVLSGRQPFCMNFDGFAFKIIIRPEFNDTKQTFFEVGENTIINIKSYNAEDTSVLLNVCDANNPDGYYHTPLESWNLKKEGVGGLGDVANELFRRAFASRQNPVQAKKLGTKHVKGVLLHGPPGVGKTLIARTIAQLLNKNVPPKVISGPEIFDKYVGESQRKVRDLFIDAENDEIKYGERSPLHVLIFDEFDSIGRKRSGGDDTGSSVASQVVNQLLAKMDGPVPLNNILIIALTNRIDVLDPALLRPGRFEIQIEVKLPTFEERKEIFEIHTRTMIENEAIDNTISLAQLAKRSDNFTGAEIEGLVKSAASYALTRTITLDDETQQINNDTNNEVSVKSEDFERAFSDIRPQFGIQQHHLFTQSEDTVLPENLDQIDLLDNNTQTVLIYTDNAQKRNHENIVGKLAVESGIKCLMCIDYFDMIGMNELQACKYMKEVFQEASKTLKSVVVINHLDTILGIRYNQSILQTVVTLIRYYPNVVTIASVSSTEYAVESMELHKHFDITKKIK